MSLGGVKKKREVSDICGFSHHKRRKKQNKKSKGLKCQDGDLQLKRKDVQ